LLLFGMRSAGVYPGYFGWTARGDADKVDDAAEAEEEAANDAALATEEPQTPFEPADKGEPF
jgi:hypothetical protein